MTRKLYLSSGALCAMAVVVSVGGAETPTLVLSQTIFHPQEGGQKADTGILRFDSGAHLAANAGEAYFLANKREEVRIIDVRHAEDKKSVIHTLDRAVGLAPGATVMMLVDAEHRRSQSLLHSAGHLLAGVIEVAAPQLVAGACRHWPGESRVDFEGDAGDLKKLEALIEAGMARAIERNLPITVDADDACGRTVTIVESMRAPCGGAHVRSTAELAGFRLKKMRAKMGLLRVSYEIDSRIRA